MSNRKRTPKARSTLPPLDHGPRVQHQTGKLEVVDAADPDRPAHNVRRARVVCHYDVLHRSGSLSSEQREAADCYSMLVAIAQGARKRPEEQVRTPPWMQGHPGANAIRATHELRIADAALGRAARDLIWALAVDNTPVAELARRLQVNDQVARGFVGAALTRLAEHMESRTPQKLIDRL